jgi:hypothetical protein
MRILLLLLLLCQTACGPPIQTAVPLPSPEIWQVQFTPALAWMSPLFAQCAAAQPGVNLVVSEQSAARMDPLKTDFSFQWGDRLATPPFTAVVGQLELAVVVNPLNPLQSLSVSEIQGLFSGKLERWSQLSKAGCPACAADFTDSVVAYSYAAGQDVVEAADWIQPGLAAILAPDPAAVRQAVSKEKNAVGYLPARWVDATLRQAPVVDATPGLLLRPVLAMAPAEPQGAKRTWLLCVQASFK